MTISKDVKNLFKKNKNSSETCSLNHDIYSIIPLDSENDEKQITFEQAFNLKSSSSIEKTSIKESMKCFICNNEKGIIDNFMLLNCTHTFHFKCIVDSQSNYNGIVDENFVNNRKCIKCNTKIDLEDLLFIHTKFNKITKTHLKTYEEDIDELNARLAKMNADLRTIYNIKQKLEKQQERSKQISLTINTLL